MDIRKDGCAVLFLFKTERTANSSFFALYAIIKGHSLYAKAIDSSLRFIDGGVLRPLCFDGVVYCACNLLLCLFDFLDYRSSEPNEYPHIVINIQNITELCI